jgi:hypothetical protein
LRAYDAPPCGTEHKVQEEQAESVFRSGDLSVDLVHRLHSHRNTPRIRMVRIGFISA